MHLCRRQGTTVLFVTHDVEEALLLSDRVLVMQAHPGAIIAEVPVSLERPRHLITGGTGKTVNRVTDTWLCRCGQSKKKPYCDGSHREAGFRRAVAQRDLQNSVSL